jgi:hypothetical protein
VYDFSTYLIFFVGLGIGVATCLVVTLLQAAMPQLRVLQETKGVFLDRYIKRLKNKALVPRYAVD